MIKLIDWYIIRKYLGTFLFTMAIFAVIIVVFDVSEKLDDFLKNHAPLSKIVFQYYTGLVPFYMNQLSPLINFIAVIFFTAKMADQTEIVPVLSSGVSFNRFLYPYFIASLVIFSVSLVFNLFIIPKTNRYKVEFENVYIKPASTVPKTNTHIQLDKRTYVFVGSFDMKTKIGYKFTLEKFDGYTLRERLTTDQITWDSVKHTWKLSAWSSRYIDGLKENMRSGPSKDTVLDMRPSDFENFDNAFEAIPTKELSQRIEKEKIRGTGLMANMQYEMYNRFVYPLSAFVLTLMGVSLSSRKVRGGIGLPLGLGILLSFTYILFIQFSKMFTLKGELPPIIAVFIPNVLFGLLGLYLVKKAPK